MLALQPFTSAVASSTLLDVDIDWHIGDVITKLRKRARMNQTTLAAKVGVNKATIVRAEDGDGKVSRATYLKIAQMLKTDLAALEHEAARLQAEPVVHEPASTQAAHDAHTTPALPGASSTGDRHPVARRVARDLLIEAAAVDQSARTLRSDRQPTAAPRRPAAGSRAPDRKRRR